MASDIDEVKSRLDIVDVVGSYVKLNRAGHSYKGLCPFHREKSPSFIVTPSLQIFKCFGCGEVGDVITFIQKIERLDFGEALQTAAERAGYKLQGKREVDGRKKEIEERIYAANELAAKYWHFLLLQHNSGAEAREYVKARQLRNQELVKFQIGYAPKGNNLIAFLHKKGYTDSEMVQWGLAIERNGRIIDKFRERLMFPIWNTKGRVVAFSGRIIKPSDYAPKYLNSPETPVYHKGEILMGIYQAAEAARKEKIIILEEGNVDMLSSHGVGVENIVATGGTALTSVQLKLISRYADVVYFAFDSDAAGTKALIKGIEMSENLGLAHKALDLKGFTDPDELIRKKPNLWKEVVANPQNSVAYLLRHFQIELDLGNPDHKTELVHRMLPVLAVLKDPVQQVHFSEELGMLVGITGQDVLGQLKKGDFKKTMHEPDHFPDEQVSPNAKSNGSMQSQAPAIKRDHKEEYLLALILQVENVADLEISGEIFRDPACKQIYLLVLKSNDFNHIASQLDPHGLEVLQQILAIDVSGVADFESEFWKIYKGVYSTHLRQQILDLRRQMHLSPDNAELLEKLRYVSDELKQVG